MNDETLTDAKVRESLDTGSPGDALVLEILDSLRARGRTVEIVGVGGVGPDEAFLVVSIDGGRHMRLSAQPW